MTTQVSLSQDQKTAREYRQVISRPMHVGALISNICEGQYSSVQQAVADITLVADNCR
jgi:hypothetical protein